MIMLFPQRRFSEIACIEYQMRIIGTDGQLCRIIWLLCPDDESAKNYAREVVHDHDIELWQGDRRIESFKVEAE
jgi:hypothetical protein